MNTENWQAGEIVQAIKAANADSSLANAQEVAVTLVPSVTKAANDVSQLTIWGEGHEHRVTVARRGDGDFAASTTPPEERTGKHGTSAASLYAGVYMAATAQGIAPDVIQQILRVHASETDFRRRARANDQLELFFDVKDDDKAGDHSNDGPLGELLATVLTVEGETHKYYRFRSADGVVDFYDESGNNSRKFLMRKPVRGEVRLADGFGMRWHPVLHIMRRHAGIDWAGPVGLPIMAAGNGVIEEVKRHFDYGNYIRIRHQNGYSTAYAHMSRFAPGMVVGTHVRQGEVIGFIGATGLGPARICISRCCSTISRSTR